MKICFSVFLILFGLLVYGQDTTKNFTIENREVIWQQVFETKLSFNELKYQIKNNAIFDKLEIDSSKLFGELKQLNADYKGAGFSEGLTPIYITRSHINAFATIEFKEGKYRVTVRKIVLTQAYDDALSKQGEKTNIETYAVKNGKLAASFKKTPSTVLNFTFNNLFEVKQEKKNDW
jgi:hypothetical protein